MVCLTIVAAATLALSVLQPALPLSSGKQLPRRGAVKKVGVGIYADSSISKPLSSINWGTLDAGVRQNFTCYVQNEGNSPAVLALSTTNWNPSNASRLLTLNWDYAGRSLIPSEVIGVTFVLSVSSDISGMIDFSFDTVISGSNA